jgi:DNA-binding response OmpR family regulator
MQILVIDDDEDIRDVLTLVLSEAGYEVTTAVDGVDGLAHLRTTPPAVALVDLMLPRLDGEGLIRALQADPALAGVPVIIISGHLGAREKARELGVFSCLVKPIELDELLMTVAAAAARGAVNRAGEPSPTIH